MFKLIRQSLDAVWETKWFWFFGILAIILSGSPLFQVSKLFSSTPKQSIPQLLQVLPASFFASFFFQLLAILIVTVFFDSLLLASAHAKQKNETFSTTTWFARLKKTFLRLFLLSFVVNALLSAFYLLIFYGLSSFLPPDSWREFGAYLIFISIALIVFTMKQFGAFNIFLSQQSWMNAIKNSISLMQKNLKSLIHLGSMGLLTTIVILTANVLLQNLLSILFRLLVQSAIVYKLTSLFQFLTITSVMINISISAIFYGFVISFWMYVLLLFYKQKT